MIYLTSIGLTPGGSSTHLHTNNTQNNTNKQYIEQQNRHKQYIEQHNRHKTIHRTTQFTN